MLLRNDPDNRPCDTRFISLLPYNQLAYLGPVTLAAHISNLCYPEQSVSSLHHSMLLFTHEHLDLGVQMQTPTYCNVYYLYTHRYYFQDYDTIINGLVFFCMLHILCYVVCIAFEGSPFHVVRSRSKGRSYPYRPIGCKHCSSLLF